MNNTLKIEDYFNFNDRIKIGNYYLNDNFNYDNSMIKLDKNLEPHLNPDSTYKCKDITLFGEKWSQYLLVKIQKVFSLSLVCFSNDNSISLKLFSYFSERYAQPIHNENNRSYWIFNGANIDLKFTTIKPIKKYCYSITAVSNLPIFINNNYINFMKKNYKIGQFKIKINNSKFNLKETFDEDKIKAAKFTKVGFLSKPIFPSKPGDIIFWTKNGFVDLFDNEIQFSPNLNISDPDMWATTIWLNYNNLLLNGLSFMVWTDKKSTHYIHMMHREFLINFQRCLWPSSLFSDTINDIWPIENSIFRCRKSDDETRIYFSWVLL
jgi:hypothetical protein